MTPTHLDHNAGSPVRPEVAEAVVRALRDGGNPSSVHRAGRAARDAVENAREAVATLVGAKPGEIVFTSGGTEANNAALRPAALRGPAGPALCLVMSATEHPSVMDGHGFAPGDVTVAPVGPDGIVDLGTLAECVASEGEPVVVACQISNGETGVVQPVADVAALVERSGGVLHVDAVQGVGRFVPALPLYGASSLALSGHKLSAPSGIGALAVKDGAAGPAFAMLRGGGQEGRRRAGTENYAGIVGLGVAATLAVAERSTEASRQRGLRDAAEAALRRVAPAVVIFGEGAPRAPNTIMFAVPGLAATTAMMALDLAGILVSAGSACSSGAVGRSPVLAAMGVPPDVARGAVRLSFGWNTAVADIELFEEAFESMLHRLYGDSRVRAAA